MLQDFSCIADERASTLTFLSDFGAIDFDVNLRALLA